MNYPPDLIEKQIATIDQAWELLNTKLPKFQKIYSLWQSWYNSIVANQQERQVVTEALIIAYARMACRNGSLSTYPRCYHSEKHIDNLLYLLMSISELPASENIPDYGWSILSLFISCHDLRQAEKNNTVTFIGDNEQASYQEIDRLLTKIDSKNVLRREHKELLKTMVHGSTFGEGEDINGNIYKGNIVRDILNKVNYFESIDVELAYLACDIDTANVAASITSYAQSSIDVYNEIQNLSLYTISAKDFFGKQQQHYFFALQRFNSKIATIAFNQLKANNAPKIKQVCAYIQTLDDKLSNQAVVASYLAQIEKVSRTA